MPTVINNPSPNEGSGMGVGLVLGIVIAVLVVLALFFVYGMPALQNNQPADNTTDINVKIPDLNNNQNNDTNQTPSQ